jgi:hypothetical protein
VWVLTVTYPGGRNKQISLSLEQKPRVQQWLRNYRKLKDTLERICELNQQLLRGWRMLRWSKEPRRISVVEGREAASLARASGIF